MPNIKSAKKRVELSKISNEKNKQAKSVLKTALKKFDAAVAEGNREQVFCRSSAVVSSPVRMWSEIVQMARASLP